MLTFCHVDEDGTSNFCGCKALRDLSELRTPPSSSWRTLSQHHKYGIGNATLQGDVSICTAVKYFQDHVIIFYVLNGILFVPADLLFSRT